MKSLSHTWFAEGNIDFESKKYTLLAYLQSIHKLFDETKLYPQLGDLIFHYHNVVAFRENKRHLQEAFPKKLTGIQLQKLEGLYERLIADDETMEELEAIIEYAAVRIKPSITTGTEIYENIEARMHIEPIGLVPLDTQEGYLFLSTANHTATDVYQYRLSFFEKHDERYRTIKTTPVERWHTSISTTYEGIKHALLKAFPELPNPAVYRVHCEWVVPREETLLPIAKRCLVKHLSA